MHFEQYFLVANEPTTMWNRIWYCPEVGFSTYVYKIKNPIYHAGFRKASPHMARTTSDKTHCSCQRWSHETLLVLSLSLLKVKFGGFFEPPKSNKFSEYRGFTLSSILSFIAKLKTAIEITADKGNARSETQIFPVFSRGAKWYAAKLANREGSLNPRKHSMLRVFVFWFFGASLTRVHSTPPNFFLSSANKLCCTPTPLLQHLMPSSQWCHKGFSAPQTKFEIS